MAADFKSITSVVIKFLHHVIFPKIHEGLNDTYSDTIPNHQRIYTDATESVVHDDAVTILTDIIIDEMIVPTATLTYDDTDVQPLIHTLLSRLNAKTFLVDSTRIQLPLP